MQTPLITNFSRGILSPKFFGRVESELYNQGAADLLNFLVNAQGSVERRRGTYRVWDTGVSVPKAPGDAEDRFEVPITDDGEYTLVAVANKGNEAQMILSTKTGINRYFELRIGSTMTSGVSLVELKINEADDVSVDPEVIVGSFPTDGLQVDDAFVTRYHNLTMLRLRKQGGYNLKFWEATESPVKALEGDSPFVKIDPLPPPEYDKSLPLISQNIGYVVNDNPVITVTKKIIQYVGQVVRGRVDETIVTQQEVKNGSYASAAQKPIPSAINHVNGACIFTIPESVPAHTKGDFNVTFHSLPHTQKVEVVYPAGSSQMKTVEIGSEHWTYKQAPSTLTIRFDGFEESLGANWQYLVDNSLTKLKLTYAGPHSWKPCVVCSRRYSTEYGYAWINMRSGGLTSALDWYRGTTYAPTETVAYSGPDSKYSLYYVDGSHRHEVGTSRWSMANNGTNVTGVTIDEASINPTTGMIPSSTAWYELHREPDVTSDSVVAERGVPWVAGEDIQTGVFRLIGVIGSKTVADYYDPFPAGLQENAAAAFINSNRLMLITGTSSIPEVKASAIGDIVNFYEGVSETGSYTIQFDTDVSERIMWVVSMREGVLIGTNRNEYVLMGGASPSTVQVRRYTSNGSALPYANRFGDKIIYASRDARKMYSYAYSNELAAWYSDDITSVAEHLFRGGIQSFKYIADPFKSIWVVPRGNNGMYCLTWEPSTGVMAWSRHFDGVNVLAIEAITLQEKTVLIMIVERSGRAVVEALDLGQTPMVGQDLYVDSSEYLLFRREEDGTYTGSNGMEITDNESIDFGSSRWARFQGQPIVFMVNGETQAVYEGANAPTVNTTLTIGPFEGADIQLELEAGVGALVGIGIPFKSRLKTLPILVQSPTGAGVFKKTQVRKLRLRIDESQAFNVGNDLSDLTTVELSESENLIQNEETGYYTGDVVVEIQSRWMNRPEIYVESFYGDPLTMLAMMIDTQVYE